MKMLVLVGSLAIAGCAGSLPLGQHTLKLMERGTGTVYTGQASGFDSGTIQIVIDDKTFTGNYARVATASTFGFGQVYGSRGQSATGYMQTYGGTNRFRALLSAPGNHGLRCDLSSDGAGHGGGVCIDDANAIYDLIFQ